MPGLKVEKLLRRILWVDRRSREGIEAFLCIPRGIKGSEAFLCQDGALADQAVVLLQAWQSGREQISDAVINNLMGIEVSVKERALINNPFRLSNNHTIHKQGIYVFPVGVGNLFSEKESSGFLIPF